MSKNAKQLYNKIKDSLQKIIDSHASKPKPVHFNPVFSEHPELKGLCDAGNSHLQEVVGATLDSALETLNQIIEEAEKHKEQKDSILNAAAVEAQFRKNESDKLKFKQDCKKKLLPFLIMCYERDIDAIAEVMVQSQDNNRVQKASNIASMSVFKAANTLEQSANLNKQFAESFEDQNTKRLYDTFPTVFNSLMDNIVDLFNKFNDNVLAVSEDDVNSMWGVGLSVSVITQNSVKSVSDTCKSSVQKQYKTVFERFVMPIFNNAIRGSREVTQEFANGIYNGYKRLSDGIRDTFNYECSEIMSVTTDKMDTNSTLSSSIFTTKTAQEDLAKYAERSNELAEDEAALDFALSLQEQQEFNPLLRRGAHSTYVLPTIAPPLQYKALTEYQNPSYPLRMMNRTPSSTSAKRNAKKRALLNRSFDSFVPSSAKPAIRYTISTNKSTKKRGGKQRKTNKKKIQSRRHSRRVK